jgi:predicted DNA-binding protein (MmcQ/YjbR family)
MHIEQVQSYCESKKGVEACFPFDETTLVFKVMGKMFCLASLETIPLNLNLKYFPDLIDDLRENYNCVLPGYHMNKNHWNTIICDGTVPDKLIFKWVDESYNLVVKSLPRKIKIELENLKQ